MSQWLACSRVIEFSFVETFLQTFFHSLKPAMSITLAAKRISFKIFPRKSNYIIKKLSHGVRNLAF